MRDVFVGRQTIFDRNVVPAAHELLFRSGDVEAAGVVDDVAATNAVVQNAFTAIGLGRLVGDLPAFVNVPKGFLLGEHQLPPPTQLVLEVLETVEFDADLVAALFDLSTAGYRIALDDFEWDERLRPLVRAADIVKVDVLDKSADEIGRQVERLAPLEVQLLAEKVEDAEQFEVCKAAGFELFQGYHFARAQVVKGRDATVGRVAMLRLLAMVNDPETSFDDLADAIGHDVALSYKLLRIVSSAAYGLPRRITSVREAVVLLGLEEIRRWTTVIALVDGEPGRHHRVLVEAALTRARMCESLAPTIGRAGPEAFTVGLLSQLDRLLDAPMDELLAELPLSDELDDALRRAAGPLGALLDVARSYEHGEATVEGQESPALSSVYLEALAWTTEMTAIVAGGTPAG